MNAIDYVYNQVYKTALAKGAKDSDALSAAITAVEKFKKNKFKKVTTLISDKIKEAVKGK